VYFIASFWPEFFCLGALTKFQIGLPVENSREKRAERSGKTPALRLK
jgi:hypothetical protein